MADSVQWLSQSDYGICTSIPVEFYLIYLYIYNILAALFLICFRKFLCLLRVFVWQTVSNLWVISSNGVQSEVCSVVNLALVVRKVDNAI